MADATGTPPPNIRFEDDIQPVKRKQPAVAAPLALSEKELSVHDLDQEERARKITHDDFALKKKQTYTGFTLAWLSFQSIGTIYGDIGTSPLYVYSSTFTSQPSWDDLVGALSIIIWSLTLIVTVKYTFIVLLADDDGQGGTFALYSLLARFANISNEDPNAASAAATPQLERHDTGKMDPVTRRFRSFIEGSGSAKFSLKLVGVLGVSMVMADGVLTPAQSVLGAIQGITVVNPDLTRSAIVGISCAILIALFAIQPLGTAKLGTAFAPIVVIWLLFNLCSGIYNLVLYDYTVLKAFSPYFAGAYLVRNGTSGWRSLGGLLLAFTGVEALFADLGAFSKRAIQISWLGLAFPCLLIAYAGQAAFISFDTTGTAFTNPFFYTVPPGSFYFSMVIAILAAIVASQAMITSTFQLLTQVMRLSYFPHIKTVHTSNKFHEQVYMPLANWLLMIGTVIVTAVYNNTTSLGNAYGVCVIIVTFITTCMVSIVAAIIWRIPSYIVVFFFLVFGLLDGVYISSSLVKVPDGAWFTLLLAVLLSSIFVLWRFGKEQQWAAEGRGKVHTRDLFGTDSTGDLVLTQAFGGQRVSSASGLGIFFDKSGGTNGNIPTVFTQFVRKFKARPAITIFFHMRPLSRPSVPHDERYLVSRTAVPACYRVTLRHGYMDDVLTPDLGRQLVEHLVLYITRDRGSDKGSNASGGVARSVEHTPEIQAELDALNKAHEDQTVYIIGKEVMKVGRKKSVPGFFRWVVLELFLWIRENSRTKLADLDIDADSLVEVGFVKQI
ncbi:potassium transporter-domain-containing protein [Lasiosphaeria miniovina]|uniref:Potassium transporter-domain-containing protein n=1 Tax=Lasiosphaeria miniovina TaxID=1954250 RepID=A0AA40EAR2_9PEZI|nr:potassium transporter-domain-containing protein [Lasiosphaeria miniovina]KAK0733055.1 potassium transporter-domain-containing protein [Lasiosphaeria miniovina]